MTDMRTPLGFEPPEFLARMARAGDMAGLGYWAKAVAELKAAVAQGSPAAVVTVLNKLEADGYRAEAEDLVDHMITAAAQMSMAVDVAYLIASDRRSFRP